jgi:hypothetical protein
MTPLLAPPRRHGHSSGRCSRAALARGLLARLAVASLCACSSGDTILALNVSSSDDVGLVNELRVTVTQEGNAPIRQTFAPPLKELEKDAGRVIQPQFYRRIELPESWDEAPAEVAVQAISPNGAAPLSASTTTKIKPGAAVAAFVELERPKPDSGTAANSNDAGVDDGGAGATDGAARDGGAVVADGGRSDGAL